MKICPHKIWIEAEAVAQTRSVKKVFLEISPNSQENTCAREFFFKKLQASGLQLYLKNSLAQVFSCEFGVFLRTPFSQKTSGGCF